MSRVAMFTAPLLYLLLLAPSLAADGAVPAPPVNILFFLSDDQRSDLMGCAGHPILETPTLDRLAERGVRFRNAFVTTPICAASRASILTGMHERTHGYTFGTPPLGAAHCADSYPARLRRAGYQTGFVGKLGVRLPGEQRELLFDSLETIGRNPYLKKTGDGAVRHITEITADRAIEFLRKRDSARPFCLSVSFNAPHAEDADKVDHYPFPAAVASLYEGRVFPPPPLTDPAIFESQPPFLRRSLNRQRWHWRWDTQEKYQRNLRAYYRMISGIDGAMGRVLAELERLGLHGETVVIFSSDNGYYLGSRGFAGKWSHYDESLRVPLIIADPRLADEHRGTVQEEMVLNVDIGPTILALAGIEIPERASGRSMLPLLRGEQKGWRQDFFAEHLFDHDAIPRWEGVHGTDWCYARYIDETPPFEVLHDLAADPDELRNLASDPAHTANLARLRRRCDALRDAHIGRRR